MKKQPIQLDPVVNQMLELSDKDLKITTINMLNDIAGRVGSTHEQMKKCIKEIKQKK